MYILYISHCCLYASPTGELFPGEKKNTLHIKKSKRVTKKNKNFFFFYLKMMQYQVSSTLVFVQVLCAMVYSMCKP